MKLEFSLQVLGENKVFQNKIYEKHPLTAKLFHAEGRADRHDEDNSRFS